MHPIELATWIVAAGPALALVVFTSEMVVGMVPRRTVAPAARAIGPVVILVPAHDEAAGIGQTVDRLKGIAPQGTRLLVVADNCTDETASLAEAAGAEVARRDSPRLRGKGYALAFGRDVLANAAPPPACVVVVDADCALSSSSLEALVEAAATGAVGQAVYLMEADLKAPALVQISNFAFLVKNLVRARGLDRIGGSTLLTGSGMAFPWDVFASAPLASGDIVEDMGLGIALVRRGVAIRLVNAAEVRSPAASLRDSAVQRRRWEHGFLATALRHALPLLARGAASASRPMIALGLHLLVPPLALLLLMSALVAILLAAVGVVYGVYSAALALGALLIAALLATILAWWRHGRDIVGGRALIRAPLYVAWKIPSYARFLFRRERQWHRTPRKGEA